MTLYSNNSSNNSNNNNNNPYNVGILALECYSPRTFIAQAELEEHMGVPAGKFVAGLGQEGMAVTGDVEDINSICLTVVQRLLETYVRVYCIVYCDLCVLSIS